MLKTVFVVALGGAIGSVLRYLTAVMVQKYYAHVFPLATLLTNVIGCLLIGIFVGWLSKHQLPDTNLKWFLITGFCGGYTTFSAFGLENVSLLQSGNSGYALLYIATSVVIGLAAVYAGLWIAR